MSIIADLIIIACGVAILLKMLEDCDGRLDLKFIRAAWNTEVYVRWEVQLFSSWSIAYDPIKYNNYIRVWVSDKPLWWRWRNQ